MANEPIHSSTFIAGVAPNKNGEEQYIPVRITVDTSYDPPRLLVHSLGTVNTGLGNVYTQQMAYTGNLITYQGWAAPGTATSAAGWAIVLYTYSGNLLTGITWAGGAAAFNQVWDDRASLSYS